MLKAEAYEIESGCNGNDTTRIERRAVFLWHRHPDPTEVGREARRPNDDARIDRFSVAHRHAVTDLVEPSDATDACLRDLTRPKSNQRVAAMRTLPKQSTE